MIEPRRLLRDEQMVAGIELVLLGERGEVGAEQIAHRRTLEPLAEQPPLAARIDQSIGDERLEDQVPARALAAGQQPFGPKLVESEFLIQMVREPAGTPLARPTQRQLRELDAHDVRAGLRLERAIVGEQRHRARPRLAVGKHLDGFLSGAFLAVVDLAEREHVVLHEGNAGAALVLDDASVTVLLTVFIPFGAAQKHLGR